MAGSTTNLGLTKPTYSEDADIAVINTNMDTLDSKIGAVGSASLQAQITSANEAMSKLDSNTNETTDILASAVSCTKTTFFKTSGSSSYVGTLPSNDYKVSTFIVTIRGGGRFVTAINSVGAVATNYYNGSSWSGWEELAMKSDVTPTITDIGSGGNKVAIGKMRVISFRNTGEATTDGISLGETALFNTTSPCVYYNGTSNVDGLLYIYYNKLYITNITLNTNYNATYIRGQVIYFVS